MQDWDTHGSIRTQVALFRRRWPIVAAFVVLCVGAALGYSLQSVKIYAAEARVLLSGQQDAVVTGTALSDPNGLESYLATQVEIMRSPRVDDLVIQALPGVDLSEFTVSARGVGRTRIVAVTVEAASAEAAQSVANAYAEAYVDFKNLSAIEGVTALGASVAEKQAEIATQLRVLDEAIANPSVTAQEAESLRAQRDAIATQLAEFVQTYDQLQVNALAREGAQLYSRLRRCQSPLFVRPLSETLPTVSYLDYSEDLRQCFSLKA